MKAMKQTARFRCVFKAAGESALEPRSQVRLIYSEAPSRPMSRSAALAGAPVTQAQGARGKLAGTVLTLQTQDPSCAEQMFELGKEYVITIREAPARPSS